MPVFEWVSSLRPTWSRCGSLRRSGSLSFANPSYLVGRAAPESPAQLIDHACLRWRRSGGAIAPWTFDDHGRAIEVIVNGPYIANDFPTLISAAIAGIGLAQVPEPVAARPIAEGKLQRVLVAFAPLTPGVFLYHPGRHQVMPKLRAFIEHVKANAGGRVSTASLDE
jgi:DNA-binding transcriptional LysR family regulator